VNERPEESDHPPPWLTFLDHTADEAVEVRAGSLRELYARAAWAMFLLLADVAAAKPDETVLVDVAAPDREALMVQWLSELNYLHQTRHLVFCSFEVTEVTDTHLVARVGGARGVPVHKEIKAVTYHALRVAADGGGWHARVLFDV
jgi:SHS2 domain-containing protein